MDKNWAFPSYSNKRHTVLGNNDSFKCTGKYFQILCDFHLASLVWIHVCVFALHGKYTKWAPIDLIAVIWDSVCQITWIEWCEWRVRRFECEHTIVRAVCEFCFGSINSVKNRFNTSFWQGNMQCIYEQEHWAKEYRLNIQISEQL